MMLLQDLCLYSFHNPIKMSHLLYQFLFLYSTCVYSDFQFEAIGLIWAAVQKGQETSSVPNTLK